MMEDTTIYRENIIKKYGSWEAYLKLMRPIWSANGKKSQNRPFKDKNLAKDAQAKSVKKRLENNEKIQG